MTTQPQQTPLVTTTQADTPTLDFTLHQRTDQVVVTIERPHSNAVSIDGKEIVVDSCWITVPRALITEALSKLLTAELQP